MTEVSLKLELEDGADAAAAVAKLQSGLDAAPGVDRAMVIEDQTRGLAELAAIISAGVVLINQGTSAMAAVKDFVASARELITEIGKLKKAIIEINGTSVDLATATDAEIEAAVGG